MLKKINLLKDKDYLIDNQIKTELWVLGEHLEIMMLKAHTFSKSDDKLILEKTENSCGSYKFIKKYKHKVKFIEIKYQFIVTPSENKIKYIEKIKKEKTLTSRNAFIKILANDILNILGENINDYRSVRKKPITEIVPKIERTRKLYLTMRMRDNRTIKNGAIVVVIQEKEIKNYF